MKFWAKWVIAIAVLGAVYGVYSYRHARSYGPFKITIISPQVNLSAILIELTVSAPTSHSQKLVYSAHVVADSNEQIILPRGYMSYLAKVGPPIMTVSAYHPLMVSVSRALRDDSATPDSSLVDLGEIEVELLAVPDAERIDSLMQAIQPREVDAARVKQLGSLRKFQEWSIREQQGDKLIRHFGDLERIYQRLQPGIRVSTMLDQIEETVETIIDRSYTTPEKRQRARTIVNSLSSMQTHE